MLQGFSISPSVPEPPPQPRGIVVPDALIGTIESTKERFDNEANVHDLMARKQCDDLVKLIKQRDAFGRAKYGQPLMSQDGRNGIEDAKQELGDLMQYVMKCKLAGEDLSGFMRLVSTSYMIMRVIVKQE